MVKTLDETESPETAKVFPGTGTLHQEHRRFHKGLLYSLLRYGVSVILGFGYWMLSARMLGAEVVGIVALLTSILGLFRPISSLGEYFALIPALNRYKPGEPRAKALLKTTIKLSCSIHVVLALVFGCVASYMLIHVYHQGNYLMWLWIYLAGFYLVNHLYFLCLTPFLAYQEMHYTVVAELGAGLTRIIIVAAMVWLWGASPAAGVMAQVGGFAVALAVVLLYLPRLFPKTGGSGKFSLNTLKPDLKGIYQFSFKSMPATISISILQHADRLILGYYTTPAMLGVYALAYALFERVLMVGTNYEDMMFASASRMAASGERGFIGDIYKSAVHTSFFWVLPVVVFMAIYAQPILDLFGPEFAAGTLALIILIIGIIFDNFARITTGLIGGLNRPGLKATIVVIGALSNLGFSLLLIPGLGILGAALANTLGYLITALICLGWLARFKMPNPLDQQFLVSLGGLFALNGMISAMFYGFRLWDGLHPWGAMLISALVLGVYYGPGRRMILRPNTPATA